MYDNLFIVKNYQETRFLQVRCSSSGFLIKLTYKPDQTMSLKVSRLIFSKSKNINVLAEPRVHCQHSYKLHAQKLQNSC